MSKILVAYGTTEGQTRKIAEFIGERLRQRGHQATSVLRTAVCTFRAAGQVHVASVIDSTSAQARQVQPSHDGVILGGSLHEGRHQTSLTHFVKDHLAWLNGLPSAFFSVSLSTVSHDDAERQEAQRLARQFVEDTGLRAGIVRCFAGALLYTQYRWFKRTLMQWISRREGGDVDTSQDHEYTDWNDVGAFVDEYLARLTAAPTRAAQ